MIVLLLNSLLGRDWSVVLKGVASGQLDLMPTVDTFAGTTDQSCPHIEIGMRSGTIAPWQVGVHNCTAHLVASPWGAETCLLAGFQNKYNACT